MAGIERNRKLNKSQDFEYLKNEGIQSLQLMSGDNWTDFNDHDPGVTILEQVCYALTDLGYRAGFDVEKILKGNSTQIDRRKGAFYIPEEILGHHPVKIQDYQKLILNDFESISGVWIETLEDQFLSRVNGLYHVKLRAKGLSERLNHHITFDYHEKLYFLNGEILESDKIPEDCRDLFNEFCRYFDQRRNLGEGLGKVTILSEFLLDLKMDIVFNDNRNVDKKIAYMLSELQSFLLKPVKFHSLNEMIAQGFSIEEIYDGPRLQKGFVRDDDLGNLPEYIYKDDLVELVQNLEDIQTVKKIEFIDFKRGRVFIPDFCYPMISVDHLLEDHNDEPHLRIYYKGALMQFNPRIVKEHFEYFWHGKRRSGGYNLLDQEEGQISSVSQIDHYTGIDEYVELSDSMPVFYGVGDFGLHPDVEDKRKSESNQLIGFLMIFDQIMRNFLAQLSHLSDLYSVLPGNEEVRTYFSSTIKNLKKRQSHISFYLNNQSGVSASEVSDLYENTLNEITESKLNSFKRKDRILDHILARFNEQQSIEKKNHYTETFESYLFRNINDKSKFLQDYDLYSYHRFSKAFSITDSPGRDMSGYEYYCRFQLGLTEVKESLTSAFIEIIKEQAELNSQNLNESKFRTSEDNSLVGEMIDIKKFDLTEGEGDFEMSNSYFFGEIDASTFFGIARQVDNYKMIKSPDGTDDHYDLLFKKKEDQFVRVANGLNYEEGLLLVSEFIQYFRTIDEAGEGFYLLDHMDLLQSTINTNCGFQITDNDGKTAIDLCDLNIDVRAKLIREILDFDYELFEKEEVECELPFVIKDNSISWNEEKLNIDVPEFIKVLSNNDDDDIRIYYKNLLTQLRLLNSEGLISEKYRFEQLEKFRLEGEIMGSKQNSFIPQIRYYTLRGSKKVFNDFFGLQFSIILPNWPSRFKTDSFRLHLNEILSHSTPPHLKRNLIWLDLDEMIQFEMMYKNFISNENQPYNEVNELKSLLTQFLLNRMN